MTDQITLVGIAVAAASLLGLILALVLAYWVIRLAVTHALRSHATWTAENWPSGR